MAKKRPWHMRLLDLKRSPQVLVQNKTLGLLLRSTQFLVVFYFFYLWFLDIERGRAWNLMESPTSSIYWDVDWITATGASSSYLNQSYCDSSAYDYGDLSNIPCALNMHPAQYVFREDERNIFVSTVLSTSSSPTETTTSSFWLRQQSARAVGERRRAGVGARARLLEHHRRRSPSEAGVHPAPVSLLLSTFDQSGRVIKN